MDMSLVVGEKVADDTDETEWVEERWKCCTVAKHTVQQ